MRTHLANRWPIRTDFIWRGGLKETGAKTTSLRQRLKRGAAATDSLRNVILNIRAWKQFTVRTLVDIIKLKRSSFYNSLCSFPTGWDLTAASTKHFNKLPKPIKPRPKRQEAPPLCFSVQQQREDLQTDHLLLNFIFLTKTRLFWVNIHSQPQT